MKIKIYSRSNISPTQSQMTNKSVVYGTVWDCEIDDDYRITSESLVAVNTRGDEIEGNVFNYNESKYYPDSFTKALENFISSQKLMGRLNVY